MKVIVCAMSMVLCMLMHATEHLVTIRAVSISGNGFGGRVQVSPVRVAQRKPVAKGRSLAASAQKSFNHAQENQLLEERKREDLAKDAALHPKAKAVQPVQGSKKKVRKKGGALTVATDKPQEGLTLEQEKNRLGLLLLKRAITFKEYQERVREAVKKVAEGYSQEMNMLKGFMVDCDEGDSSEDD